MVIPLKISFSNSRPLLEGRLCHRGGRNEVSHDNEK